MRKDLRNALRTPRRREGGLRRSALARNIRGSNSIEGYEVAEDDAAAAIDGDEPFSADEKTFLEIQGYRQALGYVLAMSEADYATFDTAELRAMHYMMLSHDLGKSPGRYRKGPIYVHDERTDQVVYEGPDHADVPSLMEALAASLHVGLNSDPIVQPAMAHLNLVMIHPFRDGNGRMARALATLVLTRAAPAGAATTSPASHFARSRIADAQRENRSATRTRGCAQNSPNRSINWPAPPRLRTSRRLGSQ